MNSRGVRGGFKATIVVLVAIPVLVGAFTAAVLFIGRANGIEFWELNEDPASSLGGAYYTGFYAHVIIVVWQIGAVAALFGGVVAWSAGRRDEARMLFAGGAIGAVMGIDDFFLLHEALQVAGAPSAVLPAVYAVLVVAFTVRYRRALGWWLLLALGALAGWGTSAGIDYVHVGVPLVVEDTPKAIGTVFWTVLLVKLAYRTLSGMVVRAAPAGDELEPGAEAVTPARVRAATPLAAEVDAATTPVPAVPSMRPESVPPPARVGQETVARAGTSAGRQVDSPTVAHTSARPRHRRPEPGPAGADDRAGSGPRHAGGQPAGARPASVRVDGRSIVKGLVIGLPGTSNGHDHTGHGRTSDPASEPDARSAHRPAEPAGNRPGGHRAPERPADDDPYDIPQSRGRHGHGGR